MDLKTKKTDEYTYRLFYSRKGVPVYLAHLDMMRLFERAFQRSGLQVARTEGFSPKPKIRFALPVGVGVELSCDPFEVDFNFAYTPETIMNKLNSALTQDIRIVHAEKVHRIEGVKKRSIMALVKSAEYTFLLERIGRLLPYIRDKKSILVERSDKGGETSGQIDIAPLIIDIDSSSENELNALVCAGSSANLRPDLFLRSLIGIDGFTEKNSLETVIIRNKVNLSV